MNELPPISGASKTQNTQRNPLLVVLWSIVSLTILIVAIEGGAKYADIPETRLDSWQKEFGEKEYDIAVIGNSMAYRNIDFVTLEERLKKSVLNITEGGSSQQWWYLAMKNLIQQRSSHYPSFVIITFREQEFPVPQELGGYRMTDILAISERSEEIANKKTWIPTKGYLRTFLLENFRTYRGKEEIRTKAYEIARWSTRQLLTRNVSTDIQKIIGKTNAVSAQLPPPKKISIREEIEQSYLPDILQKGKELNTKLIFIRVKRRKYVAGTESASVKRKMEYLKKYLHENNAELIDFSFDPRIETKHYADTDHLNAEGKAVFTEMVAEALLPIVSK